MILRALTLAALIGLAAQTAAAQAKVGNFSLTGNGLLSAGYTGDYGNLTSSDHGLTLGGTGTISGSYYSPNFLSFNLQPFLNQSRENSGYQSISDTSGITASASIFGGSNFPGSISYSKAFNSQGDFNVPGVANFTSHGDASVLNIGWSENVPDLPHVSVSFLDGGDQFSLYGASGDLTSNYHSIMVQSNYQVAGFTLNGSYRDSVTHSETPDILGGTPESNDSDTSTFSFGIGHALPFHGSFSAAASHSDIDADFSDSSYHAGLDTVYGGLSFSPIARLNFGANYQYTDNLAASLDQSIVAAGGTVIGAPEASHSTGLTEYVNYTIPALHVTLNGTDDYRDQNFLGLSYRSNAYTGTVSYSNALLGGFFNATVGATRNQVSSSNQATLGTIGAVNYSRDVRKWTSSVVVNYSRNAETALVAYSSTGYGYTGAVGRSFGRKSHWSGSASGSRTTLSGQSGATSFSQSYSSVLNIKWVGVSGSYSKSSGNSVLTASGLTPVTVPLAVIAPSSVILYGGAAWSGGVGLTPFHGFTLSATYSDAAANTQADSTSSSSNHMKQLNAFLQYRLRKTYFTAGYTKLTQSFSTSSNLPAILASYYFGLTRWFSFL